MEIEDIFDGLDDMDIYAEEGTLVTVTEQSIKNGWDHNKALAKKHLTVGGIYTVDFTEVHSWHTDVYLREFPGVAFNSAHFMASPTDV